MSRAVPVGFAVLVSACNGGGGNAGLTGDAAIDAPVDALVCPATADEPSNSMQNAVATGVAQSQSSLVMPGLAICPAGDKDFFAVEITTTGSNLEIVVESAASEPTVDGSLLNSSGVPIMNSSPVSAMPLQRRIYVPNLNAGFFYVTAYAAPADVSHYQLSLSVTGP